MGWAAVVGALALAAATAGWSAPPPADDDGDGVSDEIDECLDTPPADLIDEAGCSVCPCDGTADGAPWASHQAYVACVKSAARAQREAGALPRRAMRAAIKAARSSTCGTDALTRCCVFEDIDEDAEEVWGRCRTMTERACEDLGDRIDWTEDMGGGSCVPNPCLF